MLNLPKNILVKNILRQDADFCVMEADYHHQHVLLKITSNQQKAQQLENEVRANEFLRDQLKNSDIFIRQGKIEQHEDQTMSVLNWVDGTVMVDKKTMYWNVMPTQQQINLLGTVHLTLRKITFTQLPEWFQHSAQEIFTEDFYRQRMRKNAEAILGERLSKQELQALEKIRETAQGSRCFQHHDLSPWNIVVQPSGALALLDSEFARWGMLGYDLAYWYIQTYTALEQPELAKTSLESWLTVWEDRFPQDHIRQQILSPLAYRIIPNLNEAKTKTQLRLAREVCEQLLDFNN